MKSKNKYMMIFHLASLILFCGWSSTASSTAASEQKKNGEPTINASKTDLKNQTVASGKSEQNKKPVQKAKSSAEVGTNVTSTNGMDEDKHQSVGEGTDQYGIWNVIERKSMESEHAQLISKLNNAQESLKTISDLKSKQDILLKEARTQLALFQQKEKENAEPPQTDLDKQSYVAGLSLAASVRSRLLTWNETGVDINQKKILAGIIDGLTESNKLSSDDAERAWSDFSALVQDKIIKKISEGEALIKKKLGDKPASLEVDGVYYQIVEAGSAWKQPPELLSLSLSERITDGKIISQNYAVSIPSQGDMPAIIKNAIPILNKGSEVVAYGLAKKIYKDNPLPSGVQPFSVMEYKLKVVDKKR